MVPLIEVTDAVIDGLAANPAAAGLPPSLFAALAATKAKTARMCSRCGRTQAKEALAGNYAAIRAAIVALAPGGLATLKAALGAERLRVVSGRNAQGAAVRWTL